MWETKKKQKYYYSGKKKKHTLKTQVLVTLTGKILALDINKGRTHDFKVFKQSKSTRKITASRVLADSGYIGIKKLCPNAKLPKKKTKLKPLTKDDKKRES